jgi:hypothetical protein
MSLLSIFKAPETIDKALGAVISAGDALVYTEEEKAEMRIKIADIHLKHIQATAGENNHTSIARRWFAMAVTAPFIFLTLGSAIFEAFGKTDIANHWQELAMSDYSNLVLMVGVFYLGAHAAKAFKS